MEALGLPRDIAEVLEQIRQTPEIKYLIILKDVIGHPQIERLLLDSRFYQNGSYQICLYAIQLVHFAVDDVP